MNNLGIFNGLWGGISGTLGLGAAEISEYTGSADKKRAQEIAMQQLSLNGLKAKADANKELLLIVGVFVLLVVVVIIKSRK